MNSDHDNAFTPLAQAATQVHELYQSLVKAGFTEPQALHLVGQILTAQQQRPSE